MRVADFLNSLPNGEIALVAPGPSLHELNLEVLKNIVPVLAIGNSFRMCSPSFLVWHDLDLTTDIFTQGRAPHAIKFCPEKHRHVQDDPLTVRYKEGKSLEFNRETLYFHITSTTTALHIALLFGVKKCYLFGFDFYNFRCMESCYSELAFQDKESWRRIPRLTREYGDGRWVTDKLDEKRDAVETLMAQLLVRGIKFVNCNTKSISQVAEKINPVSLFGSTIVNITEGRAI